MRIVAAFVIGLIFGFGILISGMANPAKVLNFFDVAGSWDPSLMFVMGGALVTTFLGYRFVLARDAPILSAAFQLPTASQIDLKLIVGSALFGVGWGLTGFCPGAALPALGTGRQEVFVFVASLIVGLVVTRLVMTGDGKRHDVDAKPVTGREF